MARDNIVQTGPASHKYYSVPARYQDSPDLNFSSKFRAEFSHAFSQAYLLAPHAIVHSHLEGKPLSDYIDHTAFALACSYYVMGGSPIADILNTEDEVEANRELAARNQMPMPETGCQNENFDSDW